MSESLKLSGRAVEVKVLSVADVRELLDEMREGTGEQKSVLDLHVVDLLFDDEVPASAVAKATGMSLEELAGDHDPKEMDAVIKAVRAKNPFYLGMMERLVSAGRGASAKPDRSPSSKPSAS